MIKVSDIIPFRNTTEDYSETEALKTRMRELREQRNPFFLEFTDLDPIFRWKLIGQYGRVKSKFTSNPLALYPIITQAAFSISYPVAEYEAAARLGVLTTLNGVGVPVASAILALAEPDHYCVIDFRGWRAVFGNLKRYFSIKDYLSYRNEIAKLAEELHWPIQEVDSAVWAYDKISYRPVEERNL